MENYVPESPIEYIPSHCYIRYVCITEVLLRNLLLEPFSLNQIACCSRRVGCCAVALFDLLFIGCKHGSCFPSEYERGYRKKYDAYMMERRMKTIFACAKLTSFATFFRPRGVHQTVCFTQYCLWPKANTN